MRDCVSGFDFEQIANMEKERIKHALEGERLFGEDDDGPIWAACSDDECDSEILSIFDECIRQVITVKQSEVAFASLAKQYGYDGNSTEYQAAVAAVQLPQEYVFEGEQTDELVSG